MYDLRAGTFQGFLLEESAGNQDSDMLCSLLDLYITEKKEKRHRKLVLVLDNCRYPTSFFLLLDQSSHLARFSLSVNKSCKFLNFCQLLVDVGVLEAMQTYYLGNNLVLMSSSWRVAGP